MALCENSKWIIYMWKDQTLPIPSTLLDILVLDLEISGGTIKGDVFIGTIRLSRVSGNCEPITNPDGNLLTLMFNWGKADIYMVGFTHTQVIKRFKGRFIALPRGDKFPDDFDERLKALVPPDPGDTGTGTGQQT